MLEDLSTALAGDDLGDWSGLVYRHVSPTFDPSRLEVPNFRGTLESTGNAGEMIAGAGAAGLLAPSVTGRGHILVAFPPNFTDEDEIELVDRVDVEWN